MPALGGAKDWFGALGEITGKQDIKANAESVSQYMFETKGFNTGDDCIMAEMKDIQEANEAMECGLSDVAQRRYVLSRQTDAPGSKTAVMNPADQSMATGNTGGTAQTNTTVTSAITDDAAKALMQMHFYEYGSTEGQERFVQ